MNLTRLLRSQWDRSGAVLFVLAGFASLLLGWIGISDTVFTFQQLPYLLSGGVFGVSLITVGVTLWLSADIRDEWRKIDRLEAAIDRAVEAQASGAILPAIVPQVDGYDSPVAGRLDLRPSEV